MSQIDCKICGAKVHVISAHLRKEHPEVSLQEYKDTYPGAELLSSEAQEEIARRQALKDGATKEEGAASTVTEMTTSVGGVTRQPMHVLFDLGDDKTALNKRGEPIPVTVFDRGDDAEMIPDIDKNYVFDNETLRNMLMAFEIGIPLYSWGHAGVGKTAAVEQVAARTQRPLIRVQHTLNTEESHIVGQWTARAGETIFELGPLAVAMKNGWVYLADEYDFALPSVLAVYQPVLEGKPLVIKEADAANRIIRPHPNFRFVATGNTNGSGDETGLYQGTNIQNAANYDRFHMVLEMKYMAPDREEQILVKQGGIALADAKKMVDFANRVREQFEGAKISAPISPRTLIAASRIGLMKGSYRAGLAVCFANKLSRVDKEAVDAVAARIFG